MREWVHNSPEQDRPGALRARSPEVPAQPLAGARAHQGCVGDWDRVAAPTRNRGAEAQLPEPGGGREDQHGS